MLYYRVHKESDQIKSNIRFKGTFLIANELYTAKEVDNAKLTPEYKSMHLYACDVKPKNTYFSFGARFTNSPVILTYILPVHYASALINGDYSGMEESEIKEIEEWINKARPGYCINADIENVYFQHGNDMHRNMGSDVCKFDFRK